ncbi:MAG: SDR family oxidoreductase [Nocardioidaceae bacterium]|nr:SDR family oxidoreductase [Nocardioidaceae bacterium]
MDLLLADRVYIVTAASRGLGRATAEILVQEGARVVVSSRSKAGVDECVQTLGADKVTGVVADNADPDTASALIKAAQDTFGRLDGALISVGGPPAGSVMSRPEAEWRTSFETIFMGAIRLCTAIAGELGEGGSLALVLSTSVKQPIGGLAISNGLRPGLAMVAKNLADELGPRGIRVNGLLPGRVDTERVRELDAMSGDAEASRRDTQAAIPLRRYGEPAEFGRAAAFLLSPAAAYITGVMLPVDGGITRSL